MDSKLLNVRCDNCGAEYRISSRGEMVCRFCGSNVYLSDKDFKAYKNTRDNMLMSDRFTNDEKDVENPLALGATIKDMEGAAIAHVCERNGMKCRMLKAVSDVHGKGAMTGQYKQNLEFALSRLHAALPAWL